MAQDSDENLIGEQQVQTEPASAYDIGAYAQRDPISADIFLDERSSNRNRGDANIRFNHERKLSLHDENFQCEGLVGPIFAPHTHVDDNDQKESNLPWNDTSLPPTNQMFSGAIVLEESQPLDVDPQGRRCWRCKYPDPPSICPKCGAYTSALFGRRLMRNDSLDESVSQNEQSSSRS